MRSILGQTALALCIGASGAAVAQVHDENGTNPNKIHHRVNPWGVSSDQPTLGSTGQMTPAITAHGGPVMTGAPAIHLIWYGNWNQANGSDTPAGQEIVRDFVSGLNNSNYLKINTSYTGSGGSVVSGSIGGPQEATFGYISGTRAKRLRDSDIASIVSSYISGHGGAQTNAVYFVLTSSDVNETSGFCTRYCGWHTHGTILGANIKYSFVGNANRCLAGCAAQSVSPNGNPGVDGMISVLAHELEETRSDPDLNAWFDANGAENADKCAWTFGQIQNTASNGSFYNMSLPTAPGSSAGPLRNYLVQRNLSATNSKCYIDGVTGAQ